MPNPNPLRMDPTLTAGIRRRFVAMLRRKFSAIRRGLIRLIVDEDALGLLPRRVVNSLPTDDSNPERLPPVFAPGSLGILDLEPTRFRSSDLRINDRWRALSSPDKVREFEAWLRQQFRLDVLGTDEEALWRAYVEDGYRRGAGRAFDDVNRSRRFAPGEGAFYDGSRREFLRSTFAQPVSVERVKLLAGRVFTDLRGITDAAATVMTRTLADGLVRGLSPREVARELVRGLDSVGLNRALTLARTEIIRAHAEGQLDGLESLGIEEVGVSVEWTTAGNPCPLCAPLKGMVLKISEARGMLPRHPNCRCAWRPANVGEDRRGQKRSRRELLGAVGKSVKRETGEDTVREAKEKSRWVGADLEPSRERPRSVLNSVSRWIVNHVRAKRKL